MPNIEIDRADLLSLPLEGGLGDSAAFCARELLRLGANPNAADNLKSTPLMFAAQHDHLEVVRQLLAAEADPNARGDHGFTPLGFAQQNGH